MRYLFKKTWIKIPLIFLLLVYFVPYFFFRPEFFLLCFFSSFFIYVFYGKINKRFIYATLFLLALYVLVYSFFHFRGNSWDAYYYVRNVLLLKEKNLRPLTFIETPYFPYFGELFLAFVWKVFGFHYANMLFGLIALLSILIVYKLFSELGLSRDLSAVSLLILFASPLFLHFIFFQYKFDLFLFLFVLLAAVFWLRLLKGFLWPGNFALAGLFLSLAVLTKVTFLPFAILLIFFIGLRLWKSFNTLSRTTAFSYLLLGFCFVFPLIFWYFYSGGVKIPFVGSFSSSSPPIILDRDSVVLRGCWTEKHRADYTHNHFDSDPLWKQPYFFVTNSSGKLNGFYNMFDPGVFLYLSIFIFPLVGRAIYNDPRYSTYLFVYVILALTLYFVYVRGVFWYIIFVFPFLAPVLPYLCKVWFGMSQRFLFSVFGGVALSSMFLGILLSLGQLDTSPNLAELSGTYLRGVREQNESISRIILSGYVLDASEHPYHVNFMFFPNYDIRVLRSNYYFVAANKSLHEMHRELVDNDIKYIAVYKNKLLNSWYQGLPKRNNEILLKFLDEYTIPVYLEDNESTILFEIT